MKSPWVNVVFHSLCYYAVWVVAIYAASQGHAWLAPLVCAPIIIVQLLWQWRVVEDTRRLWALMVALFVLSTLVDGVLLWSGVIVYHANPFAVWVSPPWLWVLWIEFAIFLQALCQPYWRRSGWLAALTFIFFPIVFAGGARLGAATLVHGVWSALIIGVVWAVLLPSLLAVMDSRRSLSSTPIEDQNDSA